MTKPTHNLTERHNIALVGAGVFAHNLSKVFPSSDFQLKYVVDEFKQGEYLGAQIISAKQLDAAKDQSIAKYIIAISTAKYRQAAIERLLKQGIASDKIFAIDDDPSIPILQLIFSAYLNQARDFFVSAQCTDMYALEQHCFGDTWQQTLGNLDPNKATLAFGFYGRGGGFRRHLGGLVEPLKSKYNLLTLMDEEFNGDNFGLTKLYMGPSSAKQLEQIDACITAHFIECSPSNKPKLNILHTSFDFILEPRWIQDRLDSADPHFIFASTRATFQWMQELIEQQQTQNRICLIPGGYTRLDDNLKHAESYQGPVDSIIYAPTLSLNAVQHHQLTYSSPHGVAIIRSLLANFPDKTIIFRPHPNDLKMLKDGRNDELAQPFIDILSLCEQEPRLRLDGQQTFYMDSYNASAVMISDTSSTAYTYALSTLRPVIFFSAKDEQVKEIFLKRSAFIRDREQIGKVVNNCQQMVKQIQAMLANTQQWQQQIANYRQQVCFNLGHSEQYLLDNIDYLLSNKRHPEWLYYNW